MPIRQASLDDTAGICKLFIGQIERWQRMDEQGRVEDLPYDELSIYERWLHGGAWMSIETGAIWLSHLLSGAGMPLVYEDEDILGYAEAYIGYEAEPFGAHLHIGRIISEDRTIRESLMDYLLEQASKIGQITVASTVYDQEKLKFYRSFGLSELNQIQRVILPAHGAAVGFYKVTEHHDESAEQIEDWQMPIGRLESARQHWEQNWVQLWQAVPQITARRIYRLHFNAGGQDALVIVQEQLYNPRSAEILCWTPKALSAPLINSIRDWSYKTGYRTLSMAVNEKIAKILDAELETTAHQNVILAKNV